MYFNRNFNGKYGDARIQEVIDNGQVIQREPGNWDLIEYDGSIYYIAKVPGCSSGIWGSRSHYKKRQKEKLELAVKRYRKQIKEA